MLDNYATHKPPKGLAWLKRHPRWTFHFTPASCSWLDAVEIVFARLTRHRLWRVSFGSLNNLQAAMNRYLVEHNQDPNPFVWTAHPNQLVERVARAHCASESVTTDVG